MPVPELIAYLDESRKPMRDPATGRVSGRGEHYIVAAAVVFKDDTDLRGAVAGIEQRLGYRLHYADLRSRERRLAAVTELAQTAGWDGYIFETARPLPSRHHSEHHVRAKILASAFTVLSADGGVSRVTLETRATPKKGFTQLDRKDHQVLQKLLAQKVVSGDVRLSHADKSEPLLIISDILAGARSDLLCLADQEPYPLIAHRVQRIEQLFKTSS